MIGSPRSRAFFTVAVVIGVVVATSLTAVPMASAHGSPYTTVTEGTSLDHTVTASDSTTLQVRVKYPTATPPTGGWPIILYQSGTGTGRCNNFEGISRDTLASRGYFVVSITGRGFPSRTNAWYGCDAIGTDYVNAVNDSMNDSGSDHGGPVDLQDVIDVIDWARNQSIVAVDEDHVGYLGHSHHGHLAYQLAYASRTGCNSQTEICADVQAVFASGASSYFLKGDNVSDVSNWPTAIRNDLAQAYLLLHSAQDRHYDDEVLPALAEYQRARYMGDSPSSSATAWMDARTIVDDTASVDKAGDIDIPIFIAHNPLDSKVSPEHAIQAWHAISGTGRYLYLGPCAGHSPGNCRTNNRGWFEDKIHDFFDKYLYLTSPTMGGPVYYSVPPVNPAGTDWATPTGVSTWPPPSWSADTYYLRSGNALSTSAPTTSETPDGLVSPFDATYFQPLDPLALSCSTQGYSLAPLSGLYEVVAYEYTTAFSSDTPIFGIEADIWMEDDDHDRISPVVQLWEKDATTGLLDRIATPSMAVAHIPTAVGVATDTPVRFTFKAATNGFTFESGNTMVLMLASNFKGMYPIDPILHNFRILHTPTYPSNITIITP